MTKPRPPQRTFDLRILPRLLDRGLVTREEYDKYLQSLPDLTGKHDTTAVSTETGEPGPQR